MRIRSRQCLAAAWVAALIAGCPGRRIAPEPPRRQVPGAPLKQAVKADGAMRIEGVADDMRLVNERLFAVVSAAPAQPGYRRVAGRLLDLRTRSAVDDLVQSLGPALKVAGEPAKIDVTEVSSGPEGVVSVAAVAGRPELTLRTVWSLGAGDGHLQVRTTLTNGGAAPVDVEGGDSIYLGNIVPFVPGHGDVADSAELSTHWFGFAARGQAFVYGQAGGEAFDVDVPYLSIGDSPFTGAMRTRLAKGRVPSRGELTWTAWTAPGPSLGEASERLYAAARTTVRRLEGVVQGMRPGLQVEALSGDRPFTRVTPDAKGEFSLALPPGKFKLAAIDEAGRRGAAAAASPDRGGPHKLAAPVFGSVRYQVLGDDGAPLPCRLVLLGPDDRRRTVYSEAGRGELRLAPGPWRILAVRGFEHELDERTVQVRAGGPAAKVDLALRRVVDTKGWVSADLHLHAEGSGDSEARFADRVRSLVAEGVEVAVATDHNRVSDYGPAVRSLGLERRIRVLSGSEVSTTGKVRWGHFNAFPLVDSPPHHDTDPGKLFGWIRKGGERVIQVNHPRMPPEIGYFDLAGLDPETGKSAAAAWSDDFDVIEVFNGIWLPFPDRVRRNLADWYGLLSAGVRVAAAGNSDSHKLVQQEVGWPRTYIQTGEDDPGQLSEADVISALRKGRTLVTSGPFVRATVDGVGPAGTVRPGNRATVPLEVWVHAPNWVPVNKASVVVDGKAVWELPIPPAASPLRLHGRFDVRVEGARWIVVMVEGGTHTSPAAPVDDAWSVAFTSAVHVDHAPVPP